MNIYECRNNILGSHCAISYPPHNDHPIHAHDRCELFYLIKGDGYYITEGSSYAFEPGKVLLMRPGETHRAVCFNNSEYHRMSIHFDPCIVDSIDPQRKILRPFYDRPLGMNNAYNRSDLIGTGIYDYLEQMQHPCSDNDAQCTKVLCYLLPVLVELATVFDKGFGSAKEAAFPYSHDILEFINHNISTSLSVDMLCEKFYLTRTQLYRNFKKATGVNPWEYITLKRLTLARSYINDGMAASAAAIACGFSDYSAFYRAYVKCFGTTPSGNNHTL